MNREIFHVLRYFEFFQYPPTIDELRLFLPIKTSHGVLNRELQELSKKKKLQIVQKRIATSSVSFEQYTEKWEHSKLLVESALPYLRFLHYIPSIQLLAISGSLSMLNAGQGSDIDIFMVTRAHTLWSTRCMVLIYKKVLSVVKPSIGSNLCFNLFFSEENMQLPQKKQTEYGGHELVQLKVVFEKHTKYDTLLHENTWVCRFFPNVQIKSRLVKKDKTIHQKAKLLISIDKILGKMQKIWLKQNGFSWKDGNGQLWLIQNDVEPTLEP